MIDKSFLRFLLSAIIKIKDIINGYQASRVYQLCWLMDREAINLFTSLQPGLRLFDVDGQKSLSLRKTSVDNHNNYTIIFLYNHLLDVKCIACVYILCLILLTSRTALFKPNLRNLLMGSLLRSRSLFLPKYAIRICRYINSSNFRS